MRRIIGMLAALGICLLLPVAASAADCDHSFVTMEEAATCTDPGMTYEECSLCGYQKNYQNTPALGHSFGSWYTAKEPTCEKAGQEQRDCSRCGYAETQELAAIGHSYTSQVVAPTCTKDGYTLMTCRNCGDEEKTNKVSATGHSYHVTETVAATCTKDGYTLEVCSACGDEEKTNKVSATGHSYHVTETVAATCTKDGYTLEVCSVCGDEEKTDKTDKLGHDYTSQVVAPTCTKDGYTLHTCQRCGDTEKTDATEKTGHAYDDGVVTKEPTTTAMGRITYTCMNCGDSYTETTPKLVNPFSDVKSTAYYFRAVLWAVEEGITSGTDETHFSPNQACTRAQVMTFLWRANGSPEPENAVSPFADVKPGDYYYKAVLWALEQGITSGVAEDRFGSNQYCTRAQVVTFLYRAAGSPAVEEVARFTDVSQSDYFFQSVCWAFDNGITSGVDGQTFGSNQVCTRAQVVTFLYKAQQGAE